MKCPKCGYENIDEAISCGLCAEVFNKEADTSEIESSPTEKPRKVPYGVIIFLGGLALYPIVHYIWFLDWMCSYLAILVHELGHCLVFLCFGQIAIPKLDFQYGGGMAVPIFTSGTWGPVFILGLIGFLIYLNREHKPLMITLIALAVVYPFLAFTKGEDVLVTAAGHLCEVVAVGICFYRCLIAGNAQDFERPIYAVLGWWITLHGIGFFWGLATDMAARMQYVSDTSKYHDLIMITDKTGWDFGFLATVFMLLYFIPLVLSIALVSWRMVQKQALP